MQIILSPALPCPMRHPGQEGWESSYCNSGFKNTKLVTFHVVRLEGETVPLVIKYLCSRTGGELGPAGRIQGKTGIEFSSAWGPRTLSREKRDCPHKHSHLQVHLQQGIHFLVSQTILLSLKLCVSYIFLLSPQLIFEGWKRKNPR